MTWRYSQRSGELVRDGRVVAVGYSGAGIWQDDPASEALRNKGPLPKGLYKIGRPSDTLDHGPAVMTLTAVPGSITYGRKGFLIHGDRRGGAPRAASRGCIILPRAARDEIAASGDQWLQVGP